MYTATMEYKFKPGSFQAGLSIWKEVVLPAATGRPGLHRMFVLTQDSGSLLAMGIWEDKSYAEDFMRTGIFRILLQKLEGLLVADPLPRIWDLQEEI